MSGAGSGGITMNFKFGEEEKGNLNGTEEDRGRYEGETDFEEMSGC
jgi:hypothetical protein